MATAGTNTSVKTLQTGIKEYDSSFIRNYSLFLGGLNATHQSLKQYDPQKTGYNRIFFVKMPTFMEKLLPEKTKNFRHLLEYGFTKIDGIGNTTLDMEQITGGYAGRQFDVASTSKDDTQAITISLYDFSGSPVREYLDMWITGISDPYTGFGTYHGALENDPSLKYAQYNHVAEAIYVATDPTGRSNGIEYACLLTNMIPKQVRKDQYNYNSGEHTIIQTDVEFSTVKYESPQINTLAKTLIDRFQVMNDYLEFETEYTRDQMNSHYKPRINNWPDKFNQNLSEG